MKVVNFFEGQSSLAIESTKLERMLQIKVIEASLLPGITNKVSEVN